MLKILNDSIGIHGSDIDSFDLAILRELSNNARSMNTEISERICLSPSATLRRHRKLEESNIIEGYHTKINYSLLGFQDDIMLDIKISAIVPKIEVELRRIVARYGKITDLYRCVDDPGFVIFLAVASASEVALRLHEYLPGLEFVNGLKLRLISRVSGDDPFFWESLRQTAI